MLRREYVMAAWGVTAISLGRTVVAQEGEDEEEEWPAFVPDDYEPDPYEFEGEGSEVREGVEIDGGLTVVRATYDGPEIGNFIVELVPEDGEFSELFQNQLEPYEGERAAVLEGGTYIFTVEADGPWTSEIYQPRTEEGESLPQELEGETDRVYGPYTFEGTHLASGSHAGEGNYIVEIHPMEMDVLGGFGALVFNEIGEFDGAETAFQFDGIGWISVIADGEWQLEIE